MFSISEEGGSWAVIALVHGLLEAALYSTDDIRLFRQSVGLQVMPPVRHTDVTQEVLSDFDHLKDPLAPRT